MKTLDLIRYITQHPEYTIIAIDGISDLPPMEAINYLASIDASWYDSYFWIINGTLEKGTLLVHK